MKTYKHLYEKIYSWKNLILAYRKARKHKTKKLDVVEFEKNILENLFNLSDELKNQTYKPEPLKTFILRDPKTRKISKSAFRDRIVHHALINVIGKIFEKSFIYDSCANQIGKGNLFAVKIFENFQRKVTNNSHSSGFCFKADIKHYFQEVSHEILLDIIKRKIIDDKTLNLIEKILKNFDNKDKGMPLGNLTSQFFANVYLNDLDYFVKHRLKIKFYLRYVDDFVVLHKSKSQLEVWKKEIEKFLIKHLKLELHQQKSKIFLLSCGTDFVGFRIFYYFRLLRKRNIRKMKLKIEIYKIGKISNKNFKEIFQGWCAYSMWANCYKLRKSFLNFLGFFSID